MLRYVVLTCFFVSVTTYRSDLFSISSFSNSYDARCINHSAIYVKTEDAGVKLLSPERPEKKNQSAVDRLKDQDPMISFQNILHQFLFGPKIDQERYLPLVPQALFMKLKSKQVDEYAHYPSGDIMRAELFQGKSAVHMPPSEFLHRGHMRLNITEDLMQTAVNAFTIFVFGSLDDIRNLPSEYVLNSARAISMMKIAHEKLAETWKVVKGNKTQTSISHETLEKFRPLFKYVNGREMARLNLSDNRILTYIGTHAELNRHQVGVVASKYMQENPQWSEPKYLNLMNNLLCGVPMSFMRKIKSNVYLQLTHQVFYHIRACDPLQRRFYLGMMTKTEALGKSYSWSARDVSRLGLLLAEVRGPDLAAIHPESISGITAQVMLEMPAQKLQYITEVQLRYLGVKSLNILARKVKAYQDQLRLEDAGLTTMPCLALYCSILVKIIMNCFRNLEINID